MAVTLVPAVVAFAILVLVPSCTAVADSSVRGEAISGVATVVDGDGLRVEGVSVRLFGIDAPEIQQYCRTSTGVGWKCGQYSTVELDSAVRGKRVTCFPQAKDPYGRVVAVCELDGRDLASLQVRSGWAVAYRRYSDKYSSDEEFARSRGRGVWSGVFEMPWDYRRRTREPH